MARRDSSDLYRQDSAAEWYVLLGCFSRCWRGGAAQSVAHRRHLNSAGAGSLFREHGGLSEIPSEAYFPKIREAGDLGPAGRLAKAGGAGSGLEVPSPEIFEALITSGSRAHPFSVNLDESPRARGPGGA